MYLYTHKQVRWPTPVYTTSNSIISEQDLLFLAKLLGGGAGDTSSSSWRSAGGEGEFAASFFECEEEAEAGGVGEGERDKDGRTKSVRDKDGQCVGVRGRVLEAIEGHARYSLYSLPLVH